MEPPDTRVERARSWPSALREPLTRHPLGGPSHGMARRAVRLLLLSVSATYFGCHDSNEISSPWTSLRGPYRADYAKPCQTLASTDVTLVQQGSDASGSIPGFGRIDLSVAPQGQTPRVVTAAVTIEPGCGSSSATYNYLPTDDGNTLKWFFPDGRGENCGCSGTTSVILNLTPK